MRGVFARTQISPRPGGRLQHLVARSVQQNEAGVSGGLHGFSALDFLESRRNAQRELESFHLPICSKHRLREKQSPDISCVRHQLSIIHISQIRPRVPLT